MYYCTLFLRSDDKNAPSKVLVPDIIDTLDFDDLQSPARLASAQRWRAAGFVRRNDLPRYHWHFDTREAIKLDEFDPIGHVSWLLSRLKPDASLEEARKNGIDCWLGFYWSGNGTGGGPLISVQLAELLARHKIALDVGFYYAEYENGENAV